MRTKGSPEELQRIRLVAAKLFDEERSSGYIAQLLSVDDQTVRAWRRAFKKHGREGLNAKPHSGPTPRLTDDQRRELATMLSHGPQHFWLR